MGELSRRLIVSTSLAPKLHHIERAESLARKFDTIYLPRRRGSLSALIESSGGDRALIVGADGLALHHLNGTVYRYHPNLGYVRAMNYMKGQRDAFLEAAALAPGMRVLDCTLGFGGEALLASLAVGTTGHVVGLESVPELAEMTGDGMATRKLQQATLSAAMSRVDVICADYTTYVGQIEPDAFDVIAFDPFFAHRVEGSEINIEPLFAFGDQAPLEVGAVISAVAKCRRVIVKHARDVDLPAPLLALGPRLQRASGRPVAYSIFSR